jgi:replicative DNA helicase
VTAAPMSVLDAEAAYVGALLHLPAEAALDALGFTAAEDFADRRLSIVAAVCRDLAARGVPPDPTAVLTHIRAEAIVAGADALRSLALLLADLYIAVPIPASVRHYAAGVLDAALRRRCSELAIRVGQAAEHDSLDSLIDLVHAEASAVQALRNRRAASEGGSL